MRAIHLSNEKKRDAQVGYESKAAKNALTYKTADGGSTINERYLKFTQATSTESLTAQKGDDRGEMGLLSYHAVHHAKNRSSLNARHLSR